MIRKSFVFTGIYFISGCTLLIWEWTFLFYNAFKSTGQAGELWSVGLFCIPILARTLFSRIFSEYIYLLPVSARWISSLALRISMALLAGLSPFLDESAPLSLLVFFLFCSMALFDTYLHFPFRFFCEEQKLTSAERFQALESLKKRIAVCVASSLALASLEWQRPLQSLIFLLLMLTSLGGPVIAILLKATQSSIKKPEDTREVRGDADHSATFFVLMMFLLNFCFGASGLFLAKGVIRSGLLIYGYFSVQTAFYTGFVIYCLYVFTDSKKGMAPFSGSHFWTAVKSLSICMIIISLGKDLLPLCFLAGFLGGLLYSYALNIFQCHMYSSVNRLGREKTFARVEAAGRYGLLLSQLIAGIWLQSGSDPLRALLFSSILATLFLGFSERYFNTSSKRTYP